MVIADWAMVDQFIFSCLVRETFMSLKDGNKQLFFGFQPFLDHQTASGIHELDPISEFSYPELDLNFNNHALEHLMLFL